jgi:dihydroorotase
MTDFAALRAAGAVAFSDDGVPVMSDRIAEQAIQTATELGTMVISHCEDAEMVKNYACNEGKISRLLGIPGRPAEAEDKMVARDCEISLRTGARVHIAHVSTKGSVELIRRAKAAGASVTAETCPQYFIFTEDIVPELGTMARVNPPLRTEADREAVLAGLLDGTLDILVTDHAPHTDEEKAKALVDAPSGMVGLETTFAACLTYLVRPGHLTVAQLLEKMSVLPSRLVGHNGGRIEAGAPADLMLFDPNEAWTVDPSQFRSKAHNTPFAGMQLFGRVKTTICGGKVTFQS